MKKINIFILAIFILIGLTKCEKFLVEKPVSTANPDLVLQSVQGFDAVLIGAYLPFTGWGSLFSWDVFKLNESLVDFQYAAYDPAVSNGNILSTDWTVHFTWINLYKIVGSANIVISNLDKLKNDPNQGRFEGEAKFLRAWAYFNLVQFFGDVPLVLEPVKDPSTFEPPRSPQADVYNQIVKDLMDAETKMTDIGPQPSRVNKWIAKAYLSKVFLTMAGNPNKILTYSGSSTYSLALIKAKEVISSNKYTINISYQKVFDTNGDPESIWEFKCPDLPYFNHFTFLSQGIFTPEQSFIKCFDANDVRGPAWGINTSYILNGQTYIFPLPTYMKFVDQVKDASGQQYQSTRSIKIIRLAEIYLIAAEAENEVNNGPSQDAYKWINVVRERAGINDLNGLNKQSFRDAIFIERRKELYGEGSSWFDLKRFNKFDLLKTTGRTFVGPIDSHLNYFPIFINEIDNNPNVKQNPGWPG